jgi:hypothetical protein
VLRLKPDVRLHLLQPQMVLAAVIVDQWYTARGVPICEITSGSDGQHVPNSLHYTGAALDFSVLLWPPGVGFITTIMQDITMGLQGQFQARYESLIIPPGLPAQYWWAGTVPHLHVQYNPT